MSIRHFSISLRCSVYLIQPFSNLLLIRHLLQWLQSRGEIGGREMKRQQQVNRSSSSD
jgi:hypothetical protein